MQSCWRKYWYFHGSNTLNTNITQTTVPNQASVNLSVNVANADPALIGRYSPLGMIICSFPSFVKQFQARYIQHLQQLTCHQTTAATKGRTSIL